MALDQNEKVKAVADASFLIGISFIRQWGLLKHFVSTLYIAPAVWKEVVVEGQGRPGAREIEQADFVEQRSVQNRSAVQMLQVFLNPGEAESLVLAQELGCQIVFLDELRGRKAAQSAGLTTIGVVGFLLAAKQRGLVSEIRPLLSSLLSHGFRLSQTLIEDVLRQAGESIPDF